MYQNVILSGILNPHVFPWKLEVSSDTSSLIKHSSRNHKTQIEIFSRNLCVIFSMPQACVRVSDGVKFQFRQYSFTAVSFTARWAAADPDYNTISLSMFTLLLCIVLNKIGFGSFCLAQQSSELPHLKFIPQPLSLLARED